MHKDHSFHDEVDVVMVADNIAEGVDGICWSGASFVTNEIVYMAGNHEFYRHNIDATSEQNQKAAQRMDVKLLQRDAWRHSVPTAQRCGRTLRSLARTTATRPCTRRAFE